MKKVFVSLYTGYCGSTAHEVLTVVDGITEHELDCIVDEMAIENASSYGFDMCSDECEDEDCEMEHPGMTNICGCHEPYVPEEHDMKL